VSDDRDRREARRPVWTDVFPIDGRLDVVESEEACFVVVDGDPSDWLVRFEKTGDPSSREWAQNMAEVYNRRRLQRARAEHGTSADAKARTRPT
jgi:hypothetical protein